MTAADRHLERALLLTLALHAAAMLGMAGLLAPFVPGGGLDAPARLALLAAHPWQFRLGWLPWHLTALSDVYLAWALWRTPWIPRAGAAAAALLTALALVPDQGGQLLWETQGVALARAGDPGAYLAFEARAFAAVGYWAALLYTLGGLAWTYCFARGGAWSPALTRLSAVTWSVFLAAAALPLLPALGVPEKAVAAGNALGFALLELWLALVLEQVLRRARPDAPHGRLAPWRAPARTRLLELAANSRLAREVCRLLPVLDFASDITEVVYVNYLVEADRLAAWVPEGLELQRLGPGGRWAMFTFLTYRHGHFGPAVLGPLRRLFGSPVQSNWRTYVRDPRTGREGIYFTTNAVDRGLQSLGARLMAEGLPMHLLARAEVTREGSGRLRCVLDPGQGSGPDAELELEPGPPELPAAWRDCFPDYRAMLAYAVPQDRAMSTLPWLGVTVRQEIDLGIPLSACEPLRGRVRSKAAEAVVGAAEPVCFRVPAVPFRFTGEALDRWG